MEVKMNQQNEDIRKALCSLPQAFETLSKGRKTELKRVRKPDELTTIGGFYELCSIHPVLQDRFWQMQNVIFFLPLIKHTEEVTLGGLIFRASINENRIYQVIRSNYPNDLFYLWRLTQIAIGRQKTLNVDWQDMSQALFYWGENSKRRILSDFFKAEYYAKNKPDEKEKDYNDEKD
jgi:CRISPR system Cascade subunit CasB